MKCPAALSAVIKIPQRMFEPGDKTVVAAKIELRKILRKQRAQISWQQVSRSSMQVAEHILACDAFRKAQCIMGFLAFGRELSVDLVLAQALAEGKTVAVPYIVSASSFVPVKLQNMQHFALDRFGIRTVPQPIGQISPEQIALALVPGVAFGSDGSRMGMGAGYYDRFLPRAKNAVIMGVAYDCLMQQTLPGDERDVKMQLLVSESGIHKPIRL